MEALLMNIAQAIAPSLALYLITQALKLNALIDGLPGLAKQILTVVEAYLITLAAGAAGVNLGVDLGALDASTVQTALITLFGWLIHLVFKPAPAPVAARR